MFRQSLSLPGVKERRLANSPKPECFPRLTRGNPTKRVKGYIIICNLPCSNELDLV